MPALNIIISEADHQKLRDDYEKIVAAWSQQGRQSAPPPFEHWAGTRMMAATPISAEEIEQMRLFAAIEKLVTSLHLHGFFLAHVAENGPPAESSQQLAEALATHFSLPAQYVRRLQAVFDYYQKNAGQNAAALPGADTVEGAFQVLLERTTEALDHLGSERAIGRIEGALALMVNLQVIKRDIARERTAAFKLEVRGVKKIS